MKTALLFLLILSLLIPTFARAVFYRWTDTNGVVHMTDDADKVPVEYRGKARRIEVPDSQPVPKSAAPAPEPLQRGSSPRVDAPGGHDEGWWRDRFSMLRAELKALQDARKLKEQKLVELRRKRTIFQRARDRAAVNAMQAEVTADEARIAEALNRIAALELAAARAGVPAEWQR